MLQWMGGSRRKVTTSRKSIQKRQKQYFEQRRRQLHQQTAGLESIDEEGKNWEEKNHREHRSLDILNLLNFSTSHEGKPASPSGCASDCQVETLSPKKFKVDCPDNQSNGFNGSSNEPDHWGTETQHEVYLYDLLGDDEANGNSRGTPTQEAHAAFSVNGLGKVGTETPPGSPQQSHRFNSYGCFSPSKAAKQLNSSRHHGYMLNLLNLEVDAIMQDVEMPLSGRSLDFSTGVEDSYGKLQKSLSVGRDCMQLHDLGRKVRSSFFDGKAFCDTGNNYEQLWDARSSLVDADILDENQSEMAWKRRPRCPDGDSSDFLKFGNNKVPNYALEGVCMLHKRDASKATERFNFLDSSLPKHQSSDSGHHSVETNFDFGDVNGHPNWSGFVSENARGSWSSLSEESCSSTAVREEVDGVSLANSRARENKRCGNAFGGPEIKRGAKNILCKEKHFKNSGDLQEGNNVYWSEKRAQMPMLSDSQSARNFNYISEEEIGKHGSWLFEQGYRPADTNLGLSSACPILERKKCPSLGSESFTEDFFGLSSISEPNSDSKFSYSRFKHGNCFKYLPSGSCITKMFTSFQPRSHKYCHDSPSFTEVDCWATKPDLFPDSPDFELKSRRLHSSQDALSQEDKLFSDLSAQGSVIRSDQNQAETPQVKDDQIKPCKDIVIETNMKGNRAFDYEEQSPQCKGLNEGAAETSFSVEISDKSESSADGIEHYNDDEVPLHCQKDNTEIGIEEPTERKVASKRHSDRVNSSPQLMMLESYVLQLLCVQKTAKKASEQGQ